MTGPGWCAAAIALRRTGKEIVPRGLHRNRRGGGVSPSSTFWLYLQGVATRAPVAAIARWTADEASKVVKACRRLTVPAAARLGIPFDSASLRAAANVVPNNHLLLRPADCYWSPVREAR